MKTTAALAVLLAAAPAAALTGKIAHFSGKVSVTNGPNVTIPAQRNMALKGGDVVATGRGGLAVIALDGGGQLKLKELTRITLAADAPEAALALGGVFARIAKGAGLSGQFRLRTPAAVAAVRSTEFFTAFGKKGGKGTDVWLCVNEGAVDVTAAGKQVTVPAGKGVLIAAGKSPGEPKPFEWTKGLNWNMDPAKGEVKDTTSMSKAYDDLLDEDYR